jgi:hypothetical protein
METNNRTMDRYTDVTFINVNLMVIRTIHTPPIIDVIYNQFIS